MSYENVKLWFAKDDIDRIVTIDEIKEENSHNVYHCPVCGSDLIPKATKSKRITPHFAHVDASKCSSESQIHFWFKHKFLEQGDKFTVVSDKEREYVVKDILVEQSYKTESGKYRPDVTVTTLCGNIIYFEMAFSNKKKVKDYLDMWLELKNIVVEIDIKQLMNKNEIPKFKALFYDGKCFNTKRNDTYYNTIGKYKEEKLKGDADEKLKERIRKLDWFWDDVFRYKKGEVDINYMVELIDNIDFNDYEIVKVILNKQKCTDIYNDYLENKSKNYLKYISDYFQEYYQYDFYNISLDYSYGKPRILLRSDRLNYIYAYDIEDYMIDKIIEEIKSILDKLIFEIKEESNLTNAKENQFIRNAIDKLDVKYKKIDKHYGFHDRFGYKPIVSLHYNCDYKLDIHLPENIIFSTDQELIYDFFDEKINNYINTVVPFDNHSSLENILNKIKEKYNRILFKDKIYYQVKVDKRKYETKCRIEDRIHEIKYKRIAEDMIDLDVGIKLGNGYKHYHIYFYQDKIYLLTDFDYKFALKIINKEVESYSSFNISNLEILISDILNNQIAESLNKSECVDCSNEINLTNGEIKFYINNGLFLPKRCKPCRKKRKQNK